MDTVLLTGISGFLGGHVALALLQSEYRVKGSVRNLSSSPAIIEGLTQHGANPDHIEIVELDLMKDEGWAQAMQDVRYLQHVASPYTVNQPRDKNELIRPAVGGTERALNAALAANVERIVLTSSMAAIMYGHGPQKDLHVNADMWTNINAPDVTPYSESKTLAERRAWELMREAGRENDLAVVNPSGIFGPLLDNDPSTSGDILLRLLKGTVPAAINLAAMTAPQAGGKRIPTSAAPLSFMEIANTIGAALPAYRSKMPRFTMPDWATRLYAVFDSDVRTVLGELGKQRHVDASFARQLLGQDFIAPERAIAEMAQSIVARGLDK
jgi:nucleoside-diphosphate-sugar epimerase